MPKIARTASRRRPRGARQTSAAMAAPTISAPLLHLEAHWSVLAHPRYLEAAAFVWQR